MKELILQRVHSISELKSSSETQFAKMIGANQKTINQQFKGERSLSLDTIIGVLSSFEDISAEWLLRGEGEMYKTENENKNNSIDESQFVSMKKYETIVNLFDQTASELKNLALENQKLYEEIRNLRAQMNVAKSA